MPEKDFSKKLHKLVRDVDILVQQVQEGVTKIVADGVSIKEDIDNLKDKIKKPEEDE